MTEANVTKVEANHVTPGRDGQLYLASGARMGLRMWRDEQPGEEKAPTVRPYETVGYVLKGRAELHCDGRVLHLSAGDSWSVPAGARHTYRIVETFSALEATSPPARDDANETS